MEARPEFTVIAGPNGAEQGKVDYPLATFTVNLSMEICLHSIYVRNIL